MNFKRFGFVGLGLIGGSIAKAIRKIIPDAYILAYGPHPEKFAEAVKEGVISDVTKEINESFSSCDLIFLCAPVSTNNDNLKLLKPYLGASTIVTDVGSVKSPIHQTVMELGLEAQFIGGHPMAGSEKTGVSNSDPMILENAYYILAPTEQVSQDAVIAYRDLVASFGALPIILNSEEHDYVTAAVSHVPHLIAAALVNLVRDHDTSDCTMHQIAAGGFKDITRIASSSPAMWEAICMSNTENIADLLDDYIVSLQEISSKVRAAEDGFTFKLFEESKEYRDSFATQSRGPIKKIYGCYVDIPDEMGALASVATYLATHQISIKNIGIVHNREFEEGVLQIEFYEQSSLDKAMALLETRAYKVYARK